ncbi:outer membrane protein TolC [Wenyingzhuangia heitensis]|uniref:Outer membrane protein TolC n=1 Tax=Wenyingzhuangia heitensis TaxID=1487859 RepID=A0ABX0U7W1_9FLAO|nr:TolC family protein [Wenyingzhuangia heitensis]NIJ44424.1 outer membrane protein TolC [Wenyingzhuangia heitensis]
MKKPLIILMCFLAYLTAPLQLKAQEKKVAKTEYSLQEAILYAVQHNRQIKNSDLEIEKAKWQKWETTAIGLPQFSGKVEYTNNLLLPDVFSEGGNDNPLRFLFPKQQLSPTITYSQLIFDGTYLVGLKSAKVFLEISKNAKSKTTNEITKAVTDAYSNHLLVQESIKITEKNINDLLENVSETKMMLKNGLIEEETLEQLEITLNDLENNATRLKSIREVSLSLLKLLMGVDDNQKVITTDSLDHLSANETDNLSFFSGDISINQNIDYKIAQNDVESKRLLYQYERARLLPSLSGFANLNSLGFGDSFTDITNNDWYTIGTVGLTLDIPIFSSFRDKAKKKQAKIDWEISQNKLEETKMQTSINIKNASIELELAINTLKNKEKNLKLAERIEDKNNTKYTEGIASSFDLRQAQIQLYSSQQEYLQAMVNVINKKAELESLTK